MILVTNFLLDVSTLRSYSVNVSLVAQKRLKVNPFKDIRTLISKGLLVRDEIVCFTIGMG